MDRWRAPLDLDLVYDSAALFVLVNGHMSRKMVHLAEALVADGTAGFFFNPSSGDFAGVLALEDACYIRSEVMRKDRLQFAQILWAGSVRVNDGGRRPATPAAVARKRRWSEPRPSAEIRIWDCTAD